ncbi:hypothetical protein ACJJTC_001542 [Scirpophaga incertulas]
MNTLFTYAVVLLAAGWAAATIRSFEDNEIVPDVLPKAPATLAKVVYPSGVEVHEGNELTPTSVKDMPTVTWDADSCKFYTVAMTDPDSPTRANPRTREFHHWLVGNVPGCAVEEGEVLTAYIGAGPPLTSGFHRYTIVVYEQPGKLVFDEPRICNTTSQNRRNFHIAKFAAKYNMGDPVAGNFFQAQYDDYSPILFKQVTQDKC